MARRARSVVPEDPPPSSTNGPQTNGSQHPDHQASAAREESEDSDTEAPSKSTVPESDMQLMVKSFIRYALACEYTRTPIKRDELSKRVLLPSHKRAFPALLAQTQTRLRKTFGMSLVLLPARDKARGWTITQVRKQAHSQAGQAAHHPSHTTTTTPQSSSKSWVLRTTLPATLKAIAQRQHQDSQRDYNAVVGTLLILVSCSDRGTCPETRARASFRRLGWFPDTPCGPFDAVVGKMVKQGYIDRIKDDETSCAAGGDGDGSGDGVMDGSMVFVLGPRGKLETLENQAGLIEVVSAIYRNGRTRDEPDHDDDGGGDMDKLKRIIEDTLAHDAEDGVEEEEEDDGVGLVDSRPPGAQGRVNGHTNGHSEPGSRRRSHTDADTPDRRNQKKSKRK